MSSGIPHGLLVLLGQGPAKRERHFSRSGNKRLAQGVRRIDDLANGNVKGRTEAEFNCLIKCTDQRDARPANHMNKTPNSPRDESVQKRKPRCKQVLVVLNNKLETLELVREEVYPPQSDLDDGNLELAVVRYHNGWEVYVALECVVFLHNLLNSRPGTQTEQPRSPAKAASRALGTTKS